MIYTYLLLFSILLILSIYFILSPQREFFVNYYYPQPDTCQAQSYPATITDRWWNPAAFAWEDANPKLSFDVCRMKTSIYELGESNCSTCTTCGVLIDGFNTKHCVPADPVTSLPKDPKLRELFLKNRRHYIWAYKNRLHTKSDLYPQLTIS
jgi:hypothetical protein